MRRDIVSVREETDVDSVERAPSSRGLQQFEDGSPREGRRGELRAGLWTDSVQSRGGPMGPVILSYGGLQGEQDPFRVDAADVLAD